MATNTLHVHPLRDLIEHELTDECPCGPEQRPEKREDGSVGWLVIHHSWDGREKHEETWRVGHDEPPADHQAWPKKAVRRFGLGRFQRHPRPGAGH